MMRTAVLAVVFAALLVAWVVIAIAVLARAVRLPRTDRGRIDG